MEDQPLDTEYKPLTSADTPYAKLINLLVDIMLDTPKPTDRVPFGDPEVSEAEVTAAVEELERGGR